MLFRESEQVGECAVMEPQTAYRDEDGEDYRVVNYLVGPGCKCVIQGRRRFGIRRHVDYSERRPIRVDKSVQRWIDGS